MGERKYDQLVEEHGLNALFDVFPFSSPSRIDLDDVAWIQDKMDGSLISSMLVGDRLWLKSKGSLFSDQAVAAMAVLNKNYLLHNMVKYLTDDDYTVIMEYCSPDNRIVVSYPEPKLTILGVRINSTGEYFSVNHVQSMCDKFGVRDNCVVSQQPEDINKFVANDINEMKGIEGFVLLFNSGLRVKIKTDEYAVLHKIKDSINSQRRLFEACVYDTADDIRASFYDDETAIALIDEMDAKVRTIYNHMVDVVERFYERNKHLDKKSFAIKGQQEMEKLHFSLAMSKYIGREVDYRATMVKHRKTWGIKDDSTE